MTTLWSIEERIVDDVKKKGVLILKTFNDNNNKEKKRKRKKPNSLNYTLVTLNRSLS